MAKRISILAVLALAGCQCQKAALGAGSSGGAPFGATSGAASSATSGSSTSGSSSGGGSSSTGSSGGGSSGSDGGAACPATYSALALSPATTAIQLDGSAAAPVAFTVKGTTPQGPVAVDPSLLAWTATRPDDTNPGNVSAGIFTPYPGAGGTVTIAATGCGASGSATVLLTLAESIQTDGGNPSAFTGSAVAGSPNAPTLVYPSDETRFPRNVYKILFQWRPNGSTAFRLTFTGPGSTVTVYTDGKDPACAAVAGAGCWQADDASWEAIAGSNAGATVQVELDCTTGPGQPVDLGKAETLGFSAKDVRGAIFYWAANRGGIERATISDAAPEDYLVGNQVKTVSPTVVDGYTVQCAACHAVSRDGLKMAASVQASGPTNVHGLWVMAVTPTPPPLPLVTDAPGATGDGYSAFSPDTRKLVWGPRNGGQLSVIDATTGQTISAIAVNGTAVTGSAVDWAPDAGVIAYADTKGGISRVDVDPTGSRFSNVQPLVAPAGGGGPGAGTFGFPMFDPEGDELVYTNGNTLFLIPPSGGTGVELAAASTIVNDAVAAPSENSMPTWAPPGDLHWIAWNSQRPYGLLTAGGNNQIWVAAVDLSKLPQDPSYPGFWLPFQNLTDKNHRAFWALDVRTDYDGGFPDAGPLPDAGPPIDGGSVADAGACVPLGNPCAPATSTCCDPNGAGDYCGTVSDGGNACIPPAFQ